MYMYRLQWSWDLGDVSPLERCPPFRGTGLGPEDVERCPHFRGCYVQASMELGPKDVSLIREVSSFQRVLCTGFSEVAT